MAIRLKAARPDDSIEVRDPETGEIFALPIISREQMRELYLDLEAIQSMAGGVTTVYVERRRTGVPNEMVTVAAVFEWKDRADARPQPEDGGVAQRPAAPAEIVGDPDLAAVAAEMAAGDAVDRQQVVEQAVDEQGDEPDEDLSAIPQHLREVV